MRPEIVANRTAFLVASLLVPAADLLLHRVIDQTIGEDSDLVELRERFGRVDYRAVVVAQDAPAEWLREEFQRDRPSIWRGRSMFFGRVGQPAPRLAVTAAFPDSTGRMESTRNHILGKLLGRYDGLAVS